MSTLKLDDPDRFADTLASQILTTTQEKQQLLETISPYERLQKLQDFLEVEIEKINIDKRINSKVKKQMERAQKEYYLNEKIKAIHHELGRKDDRSDEIEELRQKIEEAGMPKETKEKTLQELKRLEAMPGVSAEATVSRNYIEWLVSVPWKKASKEIKDIELAETILNEDHYGLEKIKERILEFLAVRQLVKQPKGRLLGGGGPPGVGKTSLAKSIARATGRKFVRLSLGGVRDEAEIRGHRRTYIGAMPGKLIQSLKKAGSSNPVFLLDEIDKMSTDFRGDPSSAFREVARDVIKNGKRDVLVKRKQLMKLLGAPKYRFGEVEQEDQVGIVTGLAWTEMGGELLTTEATVMPGKGKLIITGKLGEVMQ